MMAGGERPSRRTGRRGEREEQNRGGEGEHGGEQTFGHLRSSTSAAVVASLW